MTGRLVSELIKIIDFCLITKASRKVVCSVRLKNKPLELLVLIKIIIVAGGGKERQEGRQEAMDPRP